MSINIKVIGDRVAVTKVLEEISGDLVMPQIAQSGTFELGSVVGVGDGNGHEKVGRSIFPRSVATPVKVGDIVIFQCPPGIAATATYKLGDGVKYVFVYMEDMIGRLTKPVVCLENFEILKDYALVGLFRRRDPESMVVLPDTAKMPIEEFRFKIVQLGTGGDWPADYAVGTEVALERGRATPITLGNTEYAFVHRSDILGVINSDDELVAF